MGPKRCIVISGHCMILFGTYTYIVSTYTNAGTRSRSSKPSEVIAYIQIELFETHFTEVQQVRDSEQFLEDD